MPEPSYAHSVVVGKFWPPHLGHHHLIDTAARRSRRVSVLVIGAGWEGLPTSRRVEWLEQVHADQPHVRFVEGRCDVPVDLRSETVWAAHVAVMRP